MSKMAEVLLAGVGAAALVVLIEWGISWLDQRQQASRKQRMQKREKL